MKITYLGTAAAEGVPAVFCDCPVCRMARKTGGHNIRMRSGALVDDVLKLDFGPDSYAQMLRFGKSYVPVENVLITHSHEDHFLPTDLAYIKPPFGHRDAPLHVWGNAAVGEGLKPYCNEYLIFHEMKPFETQCVAGYSVTPLKAVHAFGETALFYRIEKDGKSLLYAHDTDEFTEEDMTYLTGKRSDLISLDCTNGILELDYIGHMGITDDLRMRDKLYGVGAADEKTVFVANHFSHNGMADYDDMCRRMPGFAVAYDGLELEF